MLRRLYGRRETQDSLCLLFSKVTGEDMRCAQINPKSQKEVLVLSPPEICWMMDNPAAFHDSRENDRHIANRNGIHVIEGDHIWESMRAFITVSAPFHVHDNRIESMALARQLQKLIEVVDHAAMMICHPDSWEARCRGSQESVILRVKRLSSMKPCRSRHVDRLWWNLNRR